MRSALPVSVCLMASIWFCMTISAFERSSFSFATWASIDLGSWSSPSIIKSLASRALSADSLAPASVVILPCSVTSAADLAIASSLTAFLNEPVTPTVPSILVTCAWIKASPSVLLLISSSILPPRAPSAAILAVSSSLIFWPVSTSSLSILSPRRPSAAIALFVSLRSPSRNEPSTLLSPSILAIAVV